MHQWVIGQFIAAGVLRGFLDIESQWAYRVPFAIQWVWPPIILAGVIFAPESPWWYGAHGPLSTNNANTCQGLFARRDTMTPGSHSSP